MVTTRLGTETSNTPLFCGIRNYWAEGIQGQRHQTLSNGVQLINDLEIEILWPSGNITQHKLKTIAGKTWGFTEDPVRWTDYWAYITFHHNGSIITTKLSDIDGILIRVIC